MWMKHFVPPEETILPLRIDQKGAEGESSRKGRTLLLSEEDNDNGEVVLADEFFSSVLFFNGRKNLWRNSSGPEGCDCAEDDGGVFFSFTLAMQMLLCVQ